LPDIPTINAYVGSGYTDEFLVEEISFTVGQGDDIAIGPWANGQSADSSVVTQFNGALGVFACQTGFSCIGAEVITVPGPNECVNMPSGFNSDKILFNAGQLQQNLV
jgi:hypothetical protein